MTCDIVTSISTDTKATQHNYWYTHAFLFRRSIAWLHCSSRRRDCQHFISETPPTAAFSLGPHIWLLSATIYILIEQDDIRGVNAGILAEADLTWPDATGKLPTQHQRHEAIDLMAGH